MADTGLVRGLRVVEDRWDDAVASRMNPVELLGYRSNLLGADARIAPAKSGCTSSKLDQGDAINGNPVRVLWVKGAGGTLASVKASGFASVYLNLFLKLESLHREDAAKDTMTPLYPLVTMGSSESAAGAETPLHAFVPFAHVDHLCPEWGTVFAKAEHGRQMLENFNQAFGHGIAWVPWQKANYGLGRQLRKVIQNTPGCTGITLGGRSWMSWGSTQRECYRNSIRLMDHLGQFAEQQAASVSQERWKPSFRSSPRMFVPAQQAG